MRVVSLFAGCGGLDLGLINTDHEIVYANDHDEDCVKSYKNFFGDHIHFGDVKDVNGKELPDFDLLTGGFPCQGFSVANIYRSEKDERNTLYLQLCRVIEETLPNFFLIEKILVYTFLNP